jgi:hypothetical protein
MCPLYDTGVEEQVAVDLDMEAGAEVRVSTRYRTLNEGVTTLVGPGIP